jgi:glycosyltransferase involved in cell wall biosynthesis
MRILYVISELSFGGAQKQVVELARQLVCDGHAVAIFTLNQDVPRQGELAGSGVSLVVDQKRSRLDPRVLWRLRRFIARWNPDVIHSFLFDADVYARLAAMATGVPVLNSERSNDYSLSALQRIAHRLTRGLAQGLVANSHAGKAFAARMFALAPEDIHVVWNGVNVEQLERQAQSTTDFRAEFFGPGEHRIACLVGAIKPAKDYAMALETARHLLRADPHWRVLFIGEQLRAANAYKPGQDSDTGQYKRDILKRYQTLEQRERIRFAGSRSDVPAIVRQCDVLFVTSTHEGFPNVVLEAMALGVPVASTDYSDIRRILPSPKQVLASRTAEDMARAVLWAYGERQQLARSQKEWVRQNGSIQKAASRLERIYRKYARQDCSPSASSKAARARSS